jgi:single-strand DNA-binding protein
MVLIGIATLGRDADLRQTSDGSTIAILSLAFSFGRKDANGKRQTQWITGTVFGERAKSLAPYLTKGTRVYVEVRDPHVQQFQKKDGTPGYSMDGRIAEITFIGGGNKPDASGKKTSGEKETTTVGGNEGGIAEMDDDIPF